MTVRTRPYAGNRLLPACRVTRATDQAVGSSVSSSVIWTAVEYDTPGLVSPMWSSTVNPNRLTAPITGVYHCEGVGTWSFASNAGARYLYLLKNGLIEAIQTGGFATNNWYLGQPVSCEVYMNQGDYIEFAGWQSSGGVLNLVPGTTGWPMSMSLSCVFSNYVQDWA